MHVEHIKQTLQPICSRWSLEVLACVDAGPVGFNELARSVGIDNGCLGRTLRRLMEVGLISRQVDGGSPVRVRYSLTAFGQDVVAILESLDARWPRVSEAHPVVLPTRHIYY